MSFYNHTFYIYQKYAKSVVPQNIFGYRLSLGYLKLSRWFRPLLYQYLSAVTQERSLQVFVQYLLFPIQYLFHIHCILSVLLPTLLNNNCSFKNSFLYKMFTSLHFDIYLPNILYHTSKRSVKFKSEQIRTVALLYNTHSLKYTDFWNITKRELIKKTQKSDI